LATDASSLVLQANRPKQAVTESTGPHSTLFRGRGQLLTCCQTDNCSHQQLSLALCSRCLADAALHKRMLRPSSTEFCLWLLFWTDLEVVMDAVHCWHHQNRIIHALLCTAGPPRVRAPSSVDTVSSTGALFQQHAAPLMLPPSQQCAVYVCNAALQSCSLIAFQDAPVGANGGAILDELPALHPTAELQLVCSFCFVVCRRLRQLLWTCQQQWMVSFLLAGAVLVSNWLGVHAL
jgi:hypothetical protein